MSEQLRILLVEDDWASRESVCQFLKRKEMEVLEADSVAAAMKFIENPSVEIDVALLDIVLPDQSGEIAALQQERGIDLARSIKIRFPEAGIVFISAYFDRGPQVIHLSTGEGHERIAFRLKGSPPNDLLEAIHKVSRRLPSLDIPSGVQTKKESVSEKLLSLLPDDTRSLVERAFNNIGDLSEAEERVFSLLGYGYDSRRIAQIEGVVPRTIDSHKGRIYEKLHLREDLNDFSQQALLTTVALLYLFKG